MWFELVTALLVQFTSVRSGYTHVNNGKIWDASKNGSWWVSRASTSATAYYLQIEPTSTMSSHNPGNRYYAFPFRCLSTVLGM